MKGDLISKGIAKMVGLLPSFLSVLAAGLVPVDQFGMAQCPWTSTLTTHFFHECLSRGNVAPAINFTLHMVGGKHGGANFTAGQDSFHGGLATNLSLRWTE